MSVRRCLTALVIATVAAACAAPAATAKTKVIVAGGPPPKASQAGSAKFPAALDLNGFFRRKATIHVGDSVRWVFSKRVVHTVTFLAPGPDAPGARAARSREPVHRVQRLHRRAVLVQRAAEPADPARPRLPAGRRHDGRHGVPQLRPVGPGVRAYKLKFTKKGNYKYICLVHPGMSGSVKVLPKSATIPSGRAYRRARIAEFAKAVKASKRLAKLRPKGNNVVAGNDKGNVAWFRFFPATRTIKAGESVRFSIASKSEIHTMTFGPQPSADLVMVQPQPSGPPRLQFNPFMFLPSDPALPPYTGRNHGDGSSTPGSWTPTRSRRRRAAST